MNSERYKRKLSAIFSADVAGYSRLMGDNEAATVETITAYRKIISELIKQHNGRLIDSPGDNVLAEFASVVDAAQCAVAIQKELKARNDELPENRKMQFRIGINLGDVIEEDGRIYGDGVNIAARLESLADPGGICISKTSFDHIESKLPLGYEYIGEQSVKNISKPVSAYKVMMEPRITSFDGGRKKKEGLSSWKKLSGLAAGIALIIIILVLLNLNIGKVQKEPQSEGKTSIVVLPFTNLSNDPEQESFTDGITEELINALAKVEGLKVISSTSAFSFKNKDVDIRTVGEKLKVDNVLEGSVRTSGKKIRISAQLINVKDDTHLWSETYDKEMKDVFVIQDEISRAVVEILEKKLLGEPFVKATVESFGKDIIIKKEQALEDGFSAFGANIEISGTVKRGLETFGANITVSGDNQGSLEFFGGNVFLSGKFKEKVNGMAGNIIISGIFEDDVNVSAASITVASNAVIKGDFVYGTALLEIQEGSRILGKMIELGTEEGKAWIREKGPGKGPQPLQDVLFNVFFLISLLIVGVLVNLLLPKQTEVITSTISEPPWRNLLFGFIFLIAAPVCIAISLITVIGIPIGIISVFLFAIMIYTSRVFVGLWIGRKILGYFKEHLAATFLWPFVVGSIVIWTLIAIPALGWLIRALALLIGLGAMWIVIWRYVKTLKQSE